MCIVKPKYRKINIYIRNNCTKLLAVCKSIDFVDIKTVQDHYQTPFLTHAVER